MILLAFLLSLLGVLKSREHQTIFWVSQSSVLFILLFAHGFGTHSLMFELYVLLFVSLSFLFLLISPSLPVVQDLASKNMEHFIESRIVLSGTVFGVVGLLLYIFGAGGAEGITRSWIEIATTRSTIELVVSNFSQLFFLLSLALLLSAFYIKRSVYILIVMILISVAFLALTRVKAYLLPFLFSIMVIYINENKSRPFKTIVYGAFFGFLVIVFYLLTTFFRWVGNSERWDYHHFIEVLNHVLEKGVERNLVEQSTQIFNYYVEAEKLLGQTYFTILNPILRVFGQSIENPMHHYSNIIYGQSFGMRGSVHPTVYVDAFANFGPLGVLTGPLWLIILHYLYKFCISQKFIGSMIFVVSTAYAIPLISRGSVYYGTLYLVISIIFMILMHWLFKRFYIKGYSY